jgi:hypothetical protein
MVLEEGKKWNSVVASRGVEVEKNQKKHRWRTAPLVFR